MPKAKSSKRAAKARTFALDHRERLAAVLFGIMHALYKQGWVITGLRRVNQSPKRTTLTIKFVKE